MMGEAKKAEEIEYGSIPLRFVALFMDLVILSAPFTMFNINMPQQAAYINFAISTIYHVGFVALWGKTPGKMLFKLKIVRDNHEEVGFLKALIRYVGVIVSQLLFFAGYILMFFDDRKQALHDKLAKTIVISEGPVIKKTNVKELLNMEDDNEVSGSD